MKFHFLIFISFCFIEASAQQFKLTDVGSISKDNKDKDFDIVKTNNGFISIEGAARSQLAYTFELKKCKYSIDLTLYDSQMNVIKKKPLAGGENIYGPFPASLKLIGDKCYIFYFQAALNEDQIFMYISELDESSLEQKSEKKILTIDQKNIGLLKSQDLFYSYKILTDHFANNNKTVVAWCSGVNNEITISVLDQNLDIIWSKNEILEEANKISLSGMGMDINDNIYLGFSDSHKKDKKYYIGTYSKTKLPVNRELIIPEGRVQSFYILPGTLKNEIRIYGFYTDEQNDLMNGAFSQVLNTENLALSSAMKYPFPESLVEKFDKDGYAKTKRNRNGIYCTGDFKETLLQDGSVSLSANSVRFENVTTSSGTTTRSFTGSLLNVFFANGSVVFNRIPKAETKAEEYVISYSFYPFALKDKLLIFYIDAQKVLDDDIDKAPGSDNPRSKNVLVAAIVEKNGKITRKIINDQLADHNEKITELTKLITESSLLFILADYKAGLSKIKATYHLNILQLSN